MVSQKVTVSNPTGIPVSYTHLAGARQAALGGADVIKDDELLSYPEYSPMEKRVAAVMEQLREVGKDKSLSLIHI